MTNRLPQQTVTFEDFMIQQLAEFGKRMVKRGKSRQEVRKWVLDRFDKGGQFNLESVGTEYLMMNLLTGDTEEFRLEPWMVFRIDAEMLREFLVNTLLTLDEGVQRTLVEYLPIMAQAKVCVVWKLFYALSDGTLPTAMGLFSYSEVLDGKNVVEGTASPIMVSMLTYLMTQGVVTLAGRWKNEVA